ncbi:hypothetical protein E4U53_002694 [Claviceps sorghi]|nr:hypothetical protein E4U53_002694 [Claviceps sorghi]
MGTMGTMDLNYDCVGEAAYWDLDYTMFLASDSGQLPDYEPMEGLPPPPPPPQSIGFWPPGGLPLLDTDAFGMGRIAGIVGSGSGSGSGSGKAPPCHRLPTATVAHRKLQYPADHSYSHAHDLMQSPASQQSLCTGSTDGTPAASPLTPSSDDAGSVPDAGVPESAWAQPDLHFQTFDAFRDDILRYSTFTADNEAAPPEWCWGIDTTTAPSLMHSLVAGTPAACSANANALPPRQAYHHPPPAPPPATPTLSSPFDQPYSVPQAVIHMDAAASTSARTSTTTTPATTSTNTQCLGSGSGSGSSAGAQSIGASGNTNMAFVRPRRGKQSVEQRRRNHIQQEQRRRAMLKNGFSDVTDLVPGLDSRDMSKSAILEKTAEWLERLVCGNKFLRDRLALVNSVNQQAQQLWTRADGDLRFF